MANFRKCFILLVLFALMEITSAAVSPLEEKLLLPPNFLKPDKITQCWNSLLSIEGCAMDVLSSFSTLHIQLSSECCSAIEGIGEICFLNILSNPPFNPFFPPLVKAFCAKMAPSAPSSKLNLRPPSPVEPRS